MQRFQVAEEQIILHPHIVAFADLNKDGDTKFFTANP